MLSIYYGTYKGSNYIDNPDLYFDNTYEDAWLENPQSKKMVMDIYKSELVVTRLPACLWVEPRLQPASRAKPVSESQFPLSVEWPCLYQNSDCY